MALVEGAGAAVGDSIARAVGGDGIETIIRFNSGLNVIDWTGYGELEHSGMSAIYDMVTPGGVNLTSFRLVGYPGVEELAFPHSAYE